MLAPGERVELWADLRNVPVGTTLTLVSRPFAGAEGVVTSGEGGGMSHGGMSGMGGVDEGWKDTVLVMPGERIKLLMAFRDYPGTFVYHCHNLEHEDAGMMRNYRVE